MQTCLAAIQPGGLTDSPYYAIYLARARVDSTHRPRCIPRARLGAYMGGIDQKHRARRKKHRKHFRMARPLVHTRTRRQQRRGIGRTENGATAEEAPQTRPYFTDADFGEAP